MLSDRHADLRHEVRRKTDGFGPEPQPHLGERVDQPQHRGNRRLCTGAGEQLGAILQRPGQVAALSRSGGDRMHRTGHRRGVEGGSRAVMTSSRICIGSGPSSGRQA
jgi:hypothetical protein